MNYLEYSLYQLAEFYLSVVTEIDEYNQKEKVKQKFTFNASDIDIISDIMRVKGLVETYKSKDLYTPEKALAEGITEIALGKLSDKLKPKSNLTLIKTYTNSKKKGFLVRIHLSLGML